MRFLIWSTFRHRITRLQCCIVYIPNANINCNLLQFKLIAFFALNIVLTMLSCALQSKDCDVTVNKSIYLMFKTDSKSKQEHKDSQEFELGAVVNFTSKLQ